MPPGSSAPVHPLSGTAAFIDKHCRHERQWRLDWEVTVVGSAVVGKRVGVGSWRGLAGIGVLLLGACSSDNKPKVASTNSAATEQPAEGCTSAAFGGREYWFCPNFSDWEAAREACTAAGLHLVSIDDAGENVFVQRHIGKKAWIGASATESEWSWADGTPLWSGGRDGHPLGGLYTNWAAQQPNNDPKHTCGGISDHDGYWNAWECSSGAAFACESDPLTTPPTAPDPSCSFQTFGEQEYWFCTAPKTFDQARESCQLAGMDLATVDASGENDFIASQVQTPSFIGLTDQKQEGAWKWIATNRLTWCDDGSAATPDSYTNWTEGQPPAEACDYRTQGDRGYWSCKNLATWNDAERACKTAEMSLARVDGADENSFLKSLLTGPTWLGGSDAESEGQWRWSDGDVLFWNSSVVAGSFANWAKKQPTADVSSNCLSIDQHKGDWRAASCANTSASICEGPATSNPELPDARDCSLMSYGSGTWSAGFCDLATGYVCEAVAPDAYKTLDDFAKSIRDDYRTWKPRISDVLFRSEAAVTEPFLRYADRFGYRECVDGLQPTGAPFSPPGQTLETLDYRQTYRGIPVWTRGYAVQRDPGTHQVEAITGRFEHDLSVDIVPLVSSEDALDVAFDALAIPKSDRHKVRPEPEGQLAIYPTSQGRKATWDLAWVFDFLEIPGREAHEVVISAHSSEVITTLSTLKQVCQSTNGQLDLMGATPLDITAFQQTEWLDPSYAAGSFVDGALPYVLATRGLSTNPASELFSKPKIYTMCPDEGPEPGAEPTRFASSETSAIIADEYSLDNEKGAAFYMAMQRCVEFMEGNLTFPANNKTNRWIGMDGVGDFDIPIQLFHECAYDAKTCAQGTIGPHYLNQKIYFTPDVIAGWDFFGASIEVACHELAHGIWDYYATPYDPFEDLETASVNEGFGDIFGNAAEMLTRAYPKPGAWCLAGDDTRNVECERNFQNPALSKPSSCKVTGPNLEVLYSECPRDYYGPQYCTLVKPCTKTQTTNCCGPHRNSTVLSHWFYLAAQGDQGVNDATCPYHVSPADTDLETSIAQVTNVALNAVFTQKQAKWTGYEGIADATVTAARDMFGADSPQADSVNKAWYAVNTKESFFEKDLPYLYPLRNLGIINPWMRFLWPIEDLSVTEWDVQITDRPFEEGVLYEAKGVFASILNEDGFDDYPLGFLRVALPYNSDKRFFWRVRPHSDELWTDCYPIHSFLGTRKPDKITDIQLDADKDSNGNFRPGPLDVEWTFVEGAISYELTLATRDLNCQPDGGDDVIALTVGNGAQDGPTVNHTVTGVQPEWHYYLNLRAVGPPDFDGQTTYGDCEKREFDTGQMRAPELEHPLDGNNTYNYHPEPEDDHDANPEWIWDGRDGPSSWEIHFFEAEQNGDCESEPAENSPVTGDYEHDGTPCPFGHCPVEVDELLFPQPNPSGYCWEVRSVAKNGKVSPFSDRWHFFYRHEPISLVSPGVSMGAHVGSEDWDGPNDVAKVPAPLPGDSYNDRVTFRWEAEADALTYVLKVGRYPWGFPLGFDANGEQQYPGEPQMDPTNPTNCYIGFNSLYSYCAFEPNDVTFRGCNGQSGDCPSGTSLTLSGAKAGKGRYCWTVWPNLDDPTDQDRQPLVETNINCYTTGPKFPIVEFDNRTSVQVSCEETLPAELEVGFDSTPITGRVILDYVPDSQFDIDVSEATAQDITWGPKCETTGPFYRDVYNCEREFTITPREGQEYWISAETFNSDAMPPVLDDDSRVHCEFNGFLTGECGGDSQPCCEGNSCDDDTALLCNEETDLCEPCGSDGGTCCPTDDRDEQCNDDDYGCDWTGNGWPKCEACGDWTDACCDGADCNDDDLICNGDNRCVSCGSSDEVCCEDPLAFGDGCYDHSWCNGGECETCGLAGFPCCPTAGQRPACEEWSACQGEVCGAKTCPKLSAPIWVSPARIGDYWDEVHDSCTLSLDGFSACSAKSLNQAVSEGMIPTVKFLSFGWFPPDDAVKVVARTVTGATGAPNVHTYDLTGEARKGFTITDQTAPGVYGIVVSGIDACGETGQGSTFGVVNYKPDP
jgi:Zn-dependent metalloprotease